VIVNHRYNLITFVPSVIIEQLHHFSNQFYVGLFISQFFDWFKVGLLADYLAPITIVFTITFVKEAFDDYQRYKKDIEANNQQVRLVNKSFFLKFLKNYSKFLKILNNFQLILINLEKSQKKVLNIFKAETCKSEIF
jgi:hypothetical protein